MSDRVISDRKLRTIMVFAFIAGTFITLFTLGLYLFKLPPWALISVFLVYTIIQISLAPILYKQIYEGKLVDLPKGIRKHFPPLGYHLQEEEGDDIDDIYDVILLRTPSSVLSAPDCGEAVGIGYLAKVLRSSGLRVLIIDSRLLGLDTMQTIELLLMYETPMLGINLNFQYLADSTAQLIQALRSRGYKSHITLGGLYASVAYEKIMATIPGVDTIVRFEGESTYPELVRKITTPEDWKEIQSLVYRDSKGGIVKNPLGQLIPNLNTIPDPARDFLYLATKIGGYAYIVSSRGCNGACSYCVQQKSVTDPKGKRWRGRDPEKVAAEVQHLREELGIRQFSFVDDDFFGPIVNGKTHALQVAESLIRRNLDLSILLSVQPRDVDYEIFTLLKQAGVDSVILAVDNFSQSVLDRYRKFTTVKQNLRSIEILKSHDIDAYLGIIMFDPWTNLDELTENLLIMQELPFLRPWQILSKLEIYHGSPLTVELEQKNLIEWDGYTAKYQFLDERIQSVYQAIEMIMKILHPSLSELDLFRWGNISYSEIDSWILSYFKSELYQISLKYTQQALLLANKVVEKQQSASEVLAATKLVDLTLQREAELLNGLTLKNISSLRKEALAHKNGLELVLSPSEEIIV
jgi:anaerobic magnesium-protoporphyrin IX monomethyl ester cyclase